jgi:hypothetical protein
MSPPTGWALWAGVFSCQNVGTMARRGVSVPSNKVSIMKAVIQFTKVEETRALPILLRHSPGTILRNRTYVLEEEAVAELRKADIRFVTLSYESSAPRLEGAGSGERV